MSKKYYITTPIFYPNEAPHIGHAYNAVVTDALARFNRSEGRKVFFLSGTDEHGLKMQRTAERKGLRPQTLADYNSEIFKKMLHVLNISNDHFIRTTEERHYKSCQAFWKLIEKAGDIYLSRYSGWYSVLQEAYYSEEDTVIGLDALRYEKDFGSLVEWNEEESYFFRLSKYQDKLLAFYENNKDFIRPNERYNEIVSFVRSGLEDLSVSRTTFNWGIPVPGNSRHIIYVWLDALTNYLTALGFPSNPLLGEYWPADLHIIGKDILRFHAIYWPAFLMSAGLPLPKRIFAHGFLLNRGKKMSKSIGNVIDPFHLIDSFGIDQLRYFFLREVPCGKDGRYTPDVIVHRINADLSNNLGNLVQRLLSMIQKNCKGTIQIPGAFLLEDESLLQKSFEILEVVRNAMENQAIHLALTAIFSLVSDTNRYFTQEAPWLLYKIDEIRFSTVIYITAEMLRRLGIMLIPFIPYSANRILDFLGIDSNHRMISHISEDFLEKDNICPVFEQIFPRCFLDKKEELLC
ncbi:MAG: methionyl-tRNA synthetase [Candidatus Tokpelaia sp. JSC161]|jgi:methionyl-tRNA synthetase|nr:MAG: methionyl-tRNA synthetase [Candidatus Tokpelaia sp. JSC161]